MFINIAKDFSRFPAGLIFEDGPYSAQAFREQHLLFAFLLSGKVMICFDGVLGYASNWLEEAFGGLIRHYNFSPSEILNRLVIISSDLAVKKEVEYYIKRFD